MEITKTQVNVILDAINKELAERILHMLKGEGKKKLEIVKHTPIESTDENAPKEYFTIEIDGKNAFPRIPLGSITTLEQAQVNFDAVKNFKTPKRDVIISEEVDHG